MPLVRVSIALVKNCARSTPIGACYVIPVLIPVTLSGFFSCKVRKEDTRVVKTLTGKVQGPRLAGALPVAALKGVSVRITK